MNRAVEALTTAGPIPRGRATGPVYLTATAQQQIAQIRQQVAATIASGHPDDQLDAQLQGLADKFKSVIDTNLQQAGIPAQGAVHERTDTAPAAG